MWGFICEEEGVGGAGLPVFERSTGFTGGADEGQSFQKSAGSITRPTS
jgi:hypothetical protein